jgi:hypothetical protein
MRASTSRLVYCVGLLVATACAVLPEAISTPVAATSKASPLSTEVRLAQAMRDRLELEAAYDPSNPAVQKTAALETALRDLAFADDVSATRRQLISALADQLSDALADRSQLAANVTAEHPRMLKANAVVSGLTAAINTEVHRNRG